jgi:hypothetical protein
MTKYLVKFSICVEGCFSAKDWIIGHWAFVSAGRQNNLLVHRRTSFKAFRFLHPKSFELMVSGFNETRSTGLPDFLSACSQSLLRCALHSQNRSTNPE